MGSAGQALLEYLLLLVLAVLVVNQLVGGIVDETQTKFGNLAHFLSYNLSTGTCEQNCFFSGYNNAQRQQ